jgi:hypothetical protein
VEKLIGREAKDRATPKKSSERGTDSKRMKSPRLAFAVTEVGRTRLHGLDHGWTEDPQRCNNDSCFGVVRSRKP